MADRIPPFDTEAEAALLGCCLLSRTALAEVVDLVLAADFYKPGHQYIFDAIATLWSSGEPVDAVTVAGLLKDEGVYDEIGGPGLLLDLQTATPAISSAVAYAGRVVRTSRLRAAISAASEILDAVYDGKDPDDVLDMVGLLAGDTRLLPRNVELPEGLSTVAEFLEWYAAQHPDEESEWIVPHFIRERHRWLYVSTEGSGKTLWLRQIASLIANGVHPFSLNVKVPQRRVLLVDCENPDDAIESQIRLIDRVTGVPMSESEDLFIWRKEQGLDLRAKRTDQAQFERVLMEVRPAVVCIGPVYKIYSNSGSSGVDLEQSALELFRFLDSLRVRFGFALLMEHHAPKGASGARELSPFGTVAWQRWPEFGIKFTPEELDDHRHPHKLVVGRFRGDRVEDVIMPSYLLRGNLSSGLPWTPIMPTGHWHDGENESPPIRHDEGELDEPF
jgi:hypothetical protein